MDFNIHMPQVWEKNGSNGGKIMCYSGCKFENRTTGQCSIPGGRKPPGAACIEDEQEEEIEQEYRAYRAMRRPNIRKPNYLNPRIP